MLIVFHPRLFRGESHETFQLRPRPCGEEVFLQRHLKDDAVDLNTFNGCCLVQLQEVPGNGLEIYGVVLEPATVVELQVIAKLVERRGWYRDRFAAL